VLRNLLAVVTAGWLPEIAGRAAEKSALIPSSSSSAIHKESIPNIRAAQPPCRGNRRLAAGNRRPRD
jgi:hypothetical protein